MTALLSKQEVLDKLEHGDPRGKDAIKKAGLVAELQLDAEVLVCALGRDVTLFKLFDASIDDESLVTQAIAASDYPHRILERASPRLRRERRVVEAALRRTGNVFGAEVIALATAVDPALGEDQELLDIAGLALPPKLPEHGLLLFVCSFELPQLDGLVPTKLASKFLEHLQAHPGVCNYRVFLPHGSPDACCTVCAKAMKKGMGGECLGRCQAKCRWADIRHQQEKTAKNQGVLIQVVEPTKNEANQMELRLGPAQAIEAQMAFDVPLKTIRVSLVGNFFTLVLAAVDSVMAEVCSWRAGGYEDFSLVHISHCDVIAALSANALVPQNIFVDGRPLEPSGIVEKGWVPSAAADPPVASADALDSGAQGDATGDGAGDAAGEGTPEAPASDMEAQALDIGAPSADAGE